MDGAFLEQTGGLLAALAVGAYAFLTERRNRKVLGQPDPTKEDGSVLDFARRSAAAAEKAATASAENTGKLDGLADQVADIASEQRKAAHELGVLQGRIEGIEKRTREAEKRLDRHNRRIDDTHRVLKLPMRAADADDNDSDNEMRVVR